MLKFASLDDEERMDPMVRVFPKVTKCSFQNFGVSGSIQEWVKIKHQRSDIFKLVSKLSRFDGLCVLPINMINDKIYILLWFWLFILVIISGLHFIYRWKSVPFVRPLNQVFCILELYHYWALDWGPTTWGQSHLLSPRELFSSSNTMLASETGCFLSWWLSTSTSNCSLTFSRR